MGNSKKSYRLEQLKLLGNLLLLSSIAVTFFSCHTSSCEDTSIRQSRKEELFAFAKAQNSLLTNLLDRNDFDGTKDSLYTTHIAEKTKRNVYEIRMKTDAQSSITRTAEALEDDFNFLGIDPDSLLDKIEGKVSHEFYYFCSYSITKYTSPFTESEIITNTHLSDKEKVSALLMYPILENNKKYLNGDTLCTANKRFRSGNSQMSQKQEEAKMQECLGQYKSARTRCGMIYAASCAIACLGGPGVAAVSVALATVSLDECLDNALYFYRDCKSRK